MTDFTEAINDMSSIRTAIHSEQFSRQDGLKAANQRIDTLTKTVNATVNADRDTLNLVMGVLLLHLIWHAGARAVEWWRWR